MEGYSIMSDTSKHRIVALIMWASVVCGMIFAGWAAGG